MLCIYPSKCTHTAVNTHKPWTHTRSSGQPFMSPGEQLGIQCLAQGHLVMVLKVERERCTFTPPMTIPAGTRLKLTTFWLQARLSTIRPQINDYRPVALTSVVMKSFERLVLAYLKASTRPPAICLQRKQVSGTMQSTWDCTSSCSIWTDQGLMSGSCL